MLIIIGKDIQRFFFSHARIETNMEDSSLDEYAPDESKLSESNPSDLLHGSESDYSSASKDSFSGSEDEDDGVLVHLCSRRRHSFLILCREKSRAKKHACGKFDPNHIFYVVLNPGDS